MDFGPQDHLVPQDTAGHGTLGAPRHCHLTGSVASTNLPRLIRRGVDLTPVRRLEATSSSPRAPQHSELWEGEASCPRIDNLSGRALRKHKNFYEPPVPERLAVCIGWHQRTGVPEVTVMTSSEYQPIPDTSSKSACQRPIHRAAQHWRHRASAVRDGRLRLCAPRSIEAGKLECAGHGRLSAAGLSIWAPRVATRSIAPLGSGLCVRTMAAKEYKS